MYAKKETNFLILNEWEDEQREWSELNISEPKKWVKNNQAKINDLKKFLKINPLIKGFDIKTKSFVGSILLDNLLIQVKPKILEIKLMKLLSYALNLDSIEPNNFSLYNIEYDGFLELLLIQLINQVDKILRRGLYKDYMELKEDLNSPRGKIDFQRYVKRYFIHKDSLPCNHYIRLKNNMFNQVLLSGMNKAAFLTQNLRIRLTLLDLVKTFKEEVEFIELSSIFIDKTLNNITRLTEYYYSAINLVKIIANPPDFFKKKEMKTMKMSGFFFNMNYFFQNLLLRFFIETIGSENVKSEISINNMYKFKSNPYKKKTQNYDQTTSY